MEILNETEFQVAPIIGRYPFPGHSLTFIVKGTFTLSPERMAEVAKGQEFPSGELYYSEYDEQVGSSVRYDSDFSYFKPRADLLLVGKCHFPGGKPSKPCRVTFQVGSRAKSIGVFGNRYWKGLFKTISDPEPFTEMELRYENSYGGEDYNKNPVGKGYRKGKIDSGSDIWPLPNIENIQHRINSPADHPEPAGFGPLGKMWHERFSKMGTYKGAWLKERWPWFPKDFDWRHFNAAPPDMQVEGYLKGDEELFFENLHPAHSHYRSQLPGIRVRLFVNELKKNILNETQFKEVTMNLDTLWVDMEAEKLVLLWRGITSVQSEDYEEIQHVFIVSEKLDEATQSIDYYHGLFLKKLTEEEEGESYEIQPVEIEETEDTVEIDKEIAEVEAQIRASLIEAGIDPDYPSEPTVEQKAEEARILKELGIEEEPERQPLSREGFMQRINQGDEFIKEDLRELDLSEIDMKEINLHSAIMSGVYLKNADLSHATLTEVDLSKADLSNANLNGVNLKDADLTGANLNHADLTGAILEDAIFEKVNLDGAILDGVSALNTSFSEASFIGARLINSNLQGADFSRSNLEMANFQGANLCEASVEGAIGKQINMSETNLTELRASNGCDFSQGSFRKAKGQESIWEKAILTGADFTYSQMEGADFTLADLSSANLSASDMKFVHFTKANLQEAKLIQMNLFQGSLEKANLTRTDFSGSNLYGVEFLDSTIKETGFEFSNLKMTKLYKV